MGCCSSNDEEAKKAAALQALRRRQQQQRKLLKNNSNDKNAPFGSSSDGKMTSTPAFFFNLNGPDSSITGTSNENAVPCFEQGLLYRISDADSWFFYNDSFDMVARVLYLFGGNSEIEIGPKTTMTRQNDGALRVSITLLPGETQHLSSGRSSGYTSHYSMHPLGEEHISRLRREHNDKVLAQSSFLLRNLAPSLNRHRLMSLNAAASGGTGSGSGNMIDGSGGSGGGAVSTVLLTYGTALTSPLRQQQEEIEQLAMQLCQANRSLFIDPIFFPNEQSLGGGRYIPPAKNFPWYRYREILPTRFTGKTRIAENVRPGDIVPGELGDTAFMCAVASLAEIPELVRRLFPVDEQTRVLSLMGCYRVRMVVDGLWTTILMDDFFPCRGLRPAFGRHRNDMAEIFVEVLQKAYAKRLGSYYALASSANVLHTLSDLTGFSCVRLDPQWEVARNDDRAAIELFETILEYSRLGFITIVNTPSAFDRSFAAQFGCASTSELADRYTNAGLKLGYSYSVQRIVRFRKKNLVLIKLRNQWNKFAEWRFDWSDTSSKWRDNPDVAEACRWTNEPDGFFWMSHNDAVNWFAGASVCRCRLSYYDYRCPGYFNDSGLANFSIEIDNTKGSDRVNLSIVLTRRNIFSKVGGVNSINSGVDGGGGGGGDADLFSGASAGGNSATTASSNNNNNGANNNSQGQQALLLSLWKLSQDGAPFRLLGNSTPNPEKLSRQEYNFLCSRDVAVDCSIEAGAAVLIVPCARGIYNEGMVLSVQTSVKFETEKFELSTNTLNTGGTTIRDNNNNDYGDDDDEEDAFGFAKQRSRRQSRDTLFTSSTNLCITTAGFRATPEPVGRYPGLRTIDRDYMEIIKGNYQRRNPNGSVDSFVDAFSMS